MTTPVAGPLRRNRDFNLLLAGSTVNSVGTGMTSLTLLLLTVSLTGSAARAGVVTACLAAGQWVMTLPAGALTDRWNRKTVMVATSLVGVFALGSVPVADAWGRLTLAHLMAVAVVIGCLNCFYGPAERGALSSIVPAEQMATALSLNMARSSAGALAGSPLAGILFGITRSLPILANAITYLWAAACAALVRTPLQPTPPTHRTRLTADVAAGLRWVGKVRAIRDIITVGMLLNLAANGALTVAYLALQQHGTRAATLGMMEAAIGGAGVMGALLAPAILRRYPIGRVCVIAVWLVVLCGCLLPARLTVWWIGTLVGIMLAAIAPLSGGMGAFQTRITPNAMQGRVASASNFVSLAMVPAANAGAGYLLQKFGHVTALLGFAGVLIAAGLICLSSRPVRTIPTVNSFAELTPIEETSIQPARTNEQQASHGRTRPL